MLAQPVDEGDAEDGADAGARAEDAQLQGAEEEDVPDEDGQQDLVGEGEGVHDEGDHQHARYPGMPARIPVAEEQVLQRAEPALLPALPVRSGGEPDDHDDLDDLQEEEGEETALRPGELEQDAAHERPDQPGDVLGHRLQHHGVRRPVLAHQVRDERPAAGPVVGAAQADQDGADDDVPEGQVAEQGEDPEEAVDETVDELGVDDQPPVAHVPDHRAEEGAEEHERRHAAEADQRHHAGRVGQFQHDPAYDQFIHPARLPPDAAGYPEVTEIGDGKQAGRFPA